MKYFPRQKNFLSSIISIVLSLVLVITISYASTTISTDINTGGNLTVSGTATSTFSTGGLTVGTNQFVVQQMSGNVGIGTSTPDANLTINSIQGQTQDLFRISTSSNTILSVNTDTSFLNLSAYGKTIIKGGVLNPRVIATLSNAGLNNCEDSFGQGDYIYIVCRGSSSMVVINISDPTNPTLAASVTNSLSNAWRIFIAGNYAYITSRNASNNFIIYDISNPYNPTLVSVTSTGQNRPSDFVVEGNYVYIGGQSTASVVVVDVSNPYKPAVVSSKSISGLVSGKIAIQGKYIYVPTSTTLNILDISNPANLLIVGQLADTSMSAFVRGKYAYTYDSSVGQGTLKVIDISNPANPTLVATERGPVPGVSLDSALGYIEIIVAGNYAILNNTTRNTVSIIDISNPLDPIYISEVGNVTTRGSLWLQGNYLYAGGYSFIVIDISGLEVSNASIGSLSVSNLNVSNRTQFGQSVNIRDALNVGNGAMFGGPLAINLSTSTTVGASALTATATSSASLISFTQNGTGDILNLFGGSNKVLTILSNSNVGIGTTSPYTRLSVAGETVSSYFTATTTTATSTFVGGATFAIGGGNVGIGTSTPTTQLQVTNSNTNATTTLEFGKTGQNKGSCLVLYDSAGTAVYAYVATGASTFTLSAVSCK